VLGTAALPHQYAVDMHRTYLLQAIEEIACSRGDAAQVKGVDGSDCFICLFNFKRPSTGVSLRMKS
jgi:hypothetical protein